MKAAKIHIKGIDYPCRNTMGAMLRFYRETGKDVSHLDGTNVVEILTFLYCCVASACKADDIPFNYGLEEFADLISMEQIEAWVNSISSEDNNETEQKKRQ